MNKLVWVLVCAGAGASLANLMTTSARAAAFYVESGGGVTQFWSGESFFSNSEIGSTSNLGGNANLGVYYGFADGKAPIDLQVGLHFRLATTSSDLTSFSTHATYANVRLQITRLFITAGITPFVWKRSATTAGIDDFLRQGDTLSFFGEAGLLWPITRDFSLGASLAGQWIQSDAGLSPRPILDAVFIMRFYFGHSGGGAGSGGGSTSNEWNGWRYPFGYRSN